MALPVLDFPNLGGRKHTRKWRILSQVLPLFGLGNKQTADVLQGTRQYGLPLCIASKQGRAIGVALFPAGEVCPRNLEQFRAGAQPLRYPACERKADFINLGMSSLYSYINSRGAGRFRAGLLPI